jgi:hypothetical protein
MPRRPPFSEADLRAAIAQATSWAGTLRFLGYGAKGANYRTVQRWASRWGIGADHFDPSDGRRRASKARATPLEEALVQNSTYSRGKLKERLLDAGLKQRRCEICGQDEWWNGRRMSLVLDHINGVANDHRLENLRIVCANCAATFNTHCGRNLPRERICPGCSRPFAPRDIRHRYCSRQCWGAINSARLLGVPQPSHRKAQRPPYEQLLAEIAATSYSAVGRTYGVSGNAVRKWVRWYQERTGSSNGAPDPNAEDGRRPSQAPIATGG